MHKRKEECVVKIRKILDELKNSPDYKKLTYDLLFASLAGNPLDVLQIEERLKEILQEQNVISTNEENGKNE